MRTKNDFFLIALLIIIVGLHIGAFFSLEKIPFLDPMSGQYPRVMAMKEALLTQGSINPLWNPYLMGGEPFTDASASGMDSPIGLLTLIFSTSVGLSLSYPLGVLLSGITMFFLARWLFKEPEVAFIVALIYSGTGYIIAMLITGSLQQTYGYALMPLVVLFALRAFKEKDWALNAVLCGVFLGLLMRISVDQKVTLFLSLIMASIFLVQLITPQFKKQLIKATIIGAIIIAVGLGLDADKILPTWETISGGARGSLSYAESAARAVSPSDLFTTAVQAFTPGVSIRYAVGEGGITLAHNREGFFAVGIVATLLAGIGIYANRKNKMVIILVACAIMCLLIVTASPFFYFLWKFVPPWSSFRYVERGFSMWTFSIALLAGFGAIKIREWAEKKKPSLDRRMIYGIIAIFIILNTMIFARAPEPFYLCNFEKIADENQVMSFYSEQQGIFRVHEWETRGIDWPVDPYTVRAGQEHLFGYTANWIPEYMNEYLAIAQQRPATFWGIMNVRFLSAQQPLNVTGLRLVQTTEPFQWDGTCPPKEVLRAYGPYIYENDEVMPRAFTAPDAVLVIGSHDAIRQVTYALMLDPAFNPRTTTLVMEDTVPVNQHELSGYRAIILASGEAIASDSLPALQAYTQAGGILIPDITAGEQQVSTQQLLVALNGTAGTPVPDENVKQIRFEQKRVELPAQPGDWLVMSERYFAFDGWSARDQDGRALTLQRANGFVTAVRLTPQSRVITFTYAPMSATIGAWITISTLVGLALFFILRHPSTRIKLKKSG